jgi:hypothetical protein
MNERKREAIARITIVAAQAMGEMPGHWVIKLEMMNGYIRTMAVGSFEAAASYLQVLPNEYDMNRFIEEQAKGA